MSPAEFGQYCDNMKNTAVWGGEPEILALAKAYNVPIHVIQGGKPPVVVHNPSDKQPLEGSPIVRISYHRKMYGLGEVSVSMNSLHPLLTLLFISTTTPCGRSGRFLMVSKLCLPAPRQHDASRGSFIIIIVASCILLRSIGLITM